MQLKHLLEFSERIHKKAMGLMSKKNKDYSEEESVHDNFRAQSLLCYILDVEAGTLSGAIEFLILFKIHRLFRLINNGETPENETLEDTVVDLHNYIDLLHTSLEEKI